MFWTKFPTMYASWLYALALCAASKGSIPGFCTFFYCFFLYSWIFHKWNPRRPGMEWLGLKMGGCGGGAQEVSPFSRSENGETSRHHRIHPFLTLTTPFRATRVSFHALIPFSYTGEGWLGLGNRFAHLQGGLSPSILNISVFFRHSENFTWKKKKFF